MEMGLVSVIRRHPLVFALACLAAVAMVFISEGSYWRSAGKLDALGEMGDARASIQALERGLLDAEMSERAFALTGRAEYLKPYAGARESIDRSFGFLERYYAGQSQSLATLGRLRALLAGRLAQLDSAIRVLEAGQATAGGTATSLLTSPATIAAIRSRSATLLDQESVKIEQSRDAVYQSLMVSRLGVAALSAIGLLAVIMYLRQSLVLERQEHQQQRLVQAEHDRLELEVGRRTAQLLELNNHLETAREDERNRLARDLHDELGSLLTSAKLDAARIKSRLAGGAPEALERLDHLVGTLNSVIAVKRRIGEDLRPSALGNLGLVVTLEILAREFAEQSGVQVYCDLAPVSLAPAAQMVVYRLVQEAITNITKYARASHVWLGLAARDGRVVVSVRDDGIGFDPSATRSTAYGLVGMRFRVAAEHGTLTVVSMPGHGTSIQVSLPEAAQATSVVAA